MDCDARRGRQLSDGNGTRCLPLMRLTLLEEAASSAAPPPLGFTPTTRTRELAAVGGLDMPTSWLALGQTAALGGCAAISGIGNAGRVSLPTVCSGARLPQRAGARGAYARSACAVTALAAFGFSGPGSL